MRLCKMNIKCQIVVQEEYRKAVVSLTHDSSMTGTLENQQNLQRDIGPFSLAEYKTRGSRELLIL